MEHCVDRKVYGVLHFLFWFSQTSLMLTDLAKKEKKYLKKKYKLYHWSRFFFFINSKHCLFLVFVLIEKIYQTPQTVVHHLSKHLEFCQKTLYFASYFQLYFRCLDIPIKHDLSCSIYFFQNSYPVSYF